MSARTGAAGAQRPGAIVVVPARDEEHRVVACLEALARQGRRHAVRPRVVLVDDGSRDRTRRLAVDALRRGGLDHEVLDGPGAGVGWARRVGLDRAARWALVTGDPHALLVSTDADSVADDGWLDALLDEALAGAAVVAGDVRLREDEPLDLAVAGRRRDAAVDRLAAVRARDGADAPHHHFSAANLALSVAAYERVGGMPTDAALEDEALLRRVREVGLAPRRTSLAVVRTSPRDDGRAPRGLGVDVAVERWRDRRRLHHRDLPLERLAALSGSTRVTVVVPARETAGTIGGVLDRTVAPLVAAGVVDEVLVVDAGSRDGTAQVAVRHGARVLQEDAIRPDLGPCRGKGDAMWRALHVATGDVVAFLDADTADPRPAHLAGIVGPLLLHPDVAMVRGAFDRPFTRADGVVQAHDGGRVTELTARPLLNVHAPLLAGFRQPLAGEFAARASLLRRMPFPVGYGVEIATLLDALGLVGLDAIAECDLGVRRNRHQPLRDLAAMALAVAVAVERRVPRAVALPSGMREPWRGGRVREVPVEERPPLAAAGPRRTGHRRDAAPDGAPHATRGRAHDDALTAAGAVGSTDGRRP